ncbi:MAG: hypothetical protein FD131_3194 [Rhodocyclaceae bacterium]|nr:MAG: hypothetical protein FD131_3194 [Rhodocyclaceae bacterium]
MKVFVLLGILGMAASSTATAAGEAPMPSYFDTSEQVEPRASRPQMPTRAAGTGKVFVIDSDASSGPVIRTGAQQTMDETGSLPASTVNQVPLPQNMDRGVKDLEAGMDDLRRYTAVMAAHIQQNGMRGFLAVPTDVKDQGQAVGRKIGGGINGIMTDVAHEMVIPEKH